MDRASLIVYSVEGVDTVPWYASFLKRDRWKLNKVKGISRVQFDGPPNKSLDRRVSHQSRCDEGCVNSRLPVNSDVMRQLI